MSNVNELYQMDRQFCADCKDGKAKAWASYFAPDGVMVGTFEKEHVVGQSAIEQAMTPLFSLPDMVFTWEPEFAEISDDGTLGVTRGTSFLSYTDEGVTKERRGRYTTVWKKVDHTWKISWDIGN